MIDNLCIKWFHLVLSLVIGSGPAEWRGCEALPGDPPDRAHRAPALQALLDQGGQDQAQAQHLPRVIGFPASNAVLKRYNVYPTFLYIQCLAGYQIQHPVSGRIISQISDTLPAIKYPASG